MRTVQRPEPSHRLCRSGSTGATRCGSVVAKQADVPDVVIRRGVDHAKRGLEFSSAGTKIDPDSRIGPGSGQSLSARVCVGAIRSILPRWVLHGPAAQRSPIRLSDEVCGSPR